jgi:sugar phosphate isomerase/epimerase
MGVKLSLAHLTALNVSPPDLVGLAAECGYDHASLRLTEVTKGDAFPIVTDRAMMRETKARMAATGVGILDVEVARLTPDARPESFLPMLEAAAELGAAHLLTQGHDPDGSRLADRYAALCDLAADHGLTADIEFLTWTGLTTLDQAAKVALASGRANAGVLIDTLHFSRSNCTPDEITALPARLFNFIQIADAPAQAPTTAEGLIHTAREVKTQTYATTASSRPRRTPRWSPRRSKPTWPTTSKLLRRPGRQGAELGHPDRQEGRVRLHRTRPRASSASSRRGTRP